RTAKRCRSSATATGSCSGTWFAVFANQEVVSKRQPILVRSLNQDREFTRQLVNSSKLVNLELVSKRQPILVRSLNQDREFTRQLVNSSKLVNLVVVPRDVVDGLRQ